MTTKSCSKALSAKRVSLIDPGEMEASEALVKSDEVQQQQEQQQPQQTRKQPPTKKHWWDRRGLAFDELS